MSNLIAKYKLKKDLPMLGKGVVFEHRKYDWNHPDRGNPGCGCMILAWDNGNCQYFKYNGKDQAWCGETYILPGQLADDKDWFEPIDYKPTKKQKILDVLRDLKDAIEEFAS